MDIETILGNLSGLPDELADALRQCVIAEDNVTRAKASLTTQQEAYDFTVAEQTLKAYADNVLTGKNQAQRDVQLKVFLGESGAIADAEDPVRDAKRELATAEFLQSKILADVKALSYHLRAAMAAAELQSALLNAGKKE